MNGRSIYAEVMLGTTDLTQEHEVEALRRSIAMLPANSQTRVFTREQALVGLEVLRAALKAVSID